MNCPVCNNSSGKNYLIKEMMYGTFKEYSYTECDYCSILWLNSKTEEVDDNKLYDDNYYSFNQNQFTESSLKKYLKTMRMKSYIWEGNPLLKLIFKIKPVNDMFYHWLKLCNFKNFNAKILDVGCGSGSLLSYLKNCGFTNLHGIDPFLDKVYIKPGLTVTNKSIFDLDDKYDCIMFHHSLEHISNPSDNMKKAMELLNKSGRMVIRIPTKDSFAWKKYGTNWVQLDAPRHKIIYTQRGFEILCEKSNLSISRQYYDSTSVQFWGSEQYSKNIPLNAKTSYAVNKEKSIFTNQMIAGYEKEALKLNAENQGDQIVYILKKDK
jgi:2-polyprenyl-3-methyl-5-hydroxy-6-metoxy-1,4-benzoquinol methylase